MKNVVCKACGAEISYGARFCSECGNKIVIEPNINPDGIHKTVETQRARKGFVKKLVDWFLVRGDSASQGVTREFDVAVSWLMRVGALLLIVSIYYLLGPGVIVFNEIVGPKMSAFCALLFGIAATVCGIKLMLRTEKYIKLGEMCAAVGIFVLYFSFLFGWKYFNLIFINDRVIPFAGLVVSVILAGYLSVLYKSQIISLCSVLGATLTLFNFEGSNEVIISLHFAFWSVVFAVFVILSRIRSGDGRFLMSSSSAVCAFCSVLSISSKILEECPSARILMLLLLNVALIEIVARTGDRAVRKLSLFLLVCLSLISFIMYNGSFFNQNLCYTGSLRDRVLCMWPIPVVIGFAGMRLDSSVLIFWRIKFSVIATGIAFYLLIMESYSAAYTFMPGFEGAMLTTIWIFVASVILFLGIVKKRYILRYISLWGLGVSIFKLLCFDIANLEKVNRMGIFFVIGILFMVLAFYYFKYRQRIVAEDDKKESDC